MKDDISQSLGPLEPEGLDVEGQNWQQRKSAQTRITILEAAIDCLNTHGYGRTTTQLIAEIAGISRGAMLHHYATKQDLIASVIDYTVYRRMEVFLSGVRSLTESERVDDVAGVELYWQSLLTREFSAYLELSIAARTDPELGEVFLPRARRYYRAEMDEVIKAFPEWSDKAEAYAVAMDYCIAAIQGLLINRDIWEGRDRRQSLRRFVAETMAMLRTGALLIPA
jgi:AcrR family transcriptional regulator